MKIFLEEMSDYWNNQNVAFYYVYYCKQNKIRVNESKIDNYMERMQQPIISEKLKEEFKKLIWEHAVRCTKSTSR